MLSGFKTLVLITLCSEQTFVKYVVGEDTGPCYNQFEYEYHVIEKLVSLATGAKKQEDIITILVKQLADDKTIIEALNQSSITKESSSTYIRWGRRTCPEGAVVLYEGYAAGNHYNNSGSGANRLCLPYTPNWGDHVNGTQNADELYSAQYQTSSNSKHETLHNKDVPCVLCRIPRNHVVMIPGRNDCYDNYVLEYRGYLMGGHYSQAGPSEYVCVDGKPEGIPSGNAAGNGSRFYFVKTNCQSLKCPSSESGREVTCAVCSYKSIR